MNAKRCKKLRAAFRQWDPSEQRWTTNHPAYKKAKKLEAQRLTAQRGGQKPKAVAAREHKPKDPVKPTWPGTPNQRAQSRPMIVVHPRRQTARDERRFTDKPEAVDRLYWGYYPKHVLDRIALCHPAEVA